MRVVHCLLFAVAAVVAQQRGAWALNNGMGRTPQLGWNSWNHFACNLDAQLVAETIDAMADPQNGLQDAGYNFVNMDDCWAGYRDKAGFIHPDEKTFPNGVKPLADRAHAAGLKFGLYSDAGLKTCAGRPGSLFYEQNDADTYASWGVDYLKYDNCNVPDNLPPEVRYPLMTAALNNTKRKIFFSMCEWGVDNPATWAPEVGNSWRTTPDIKDNWASITSRADLNDKWWSYAAPGGWNDPDMLEVGNGGLTETEEISHFSLWALMKAPLLIGCDLRNITTSNPKALAILTNKDVIAVNQDPLGVQGHKVAKHGDLEVWAGPLAATSAGKKQWVVLLFNRASSAAHIKAEWKDIGIPMGTNCNVYDLWQHKSIGIRNNDFEAQVASHGVVMVTLTEA